MFDFFIFVKAFFVIKVYLQVLIHEEEFLKKKVFISVLNLQKQNFLSSLKNINIRFLTFISTRNFKFLHGINPEVDIGIFNFQTLLDEKIKIDIIFKFIIYFFSSSLLLNYSFIDVML